MITIEGLFLIRGGDHDQNWLCLRLGGPIPFLSNNIGGWRATDELFGPVQSIIKFKTLHEVIKQVNASCYGFAAGVFT
jgi:hypothetical protein